MAKTRAPVDGSHDHNEQLLWRYYHYTRAKIRKVRVLEHVRQVIEDGQVYFPRPAELNDPRDCRPRMEVPSELQRECYVERVGRRREFADDEQRAAGKDAAKTRLSDEKSIQGVWSRNVARYGVLSLSRSKVNPHLWEHYADAGAGMCIEYSFDHLLESGQSEYTPLAVEYVDETQPLNILDYQPPQTSAKVIEFIRRSFLQKTRRWMPEEEIRVVPQVHDLNPPILPLAPMKVTGLYLGWRVSESHKRRVLNWEASIDVFEMTRSDRFRQVR